MHMVYQTSLTTVLMNLANLHAYGLSNVFDYLFLMNFVKRKLACMHGLSNVFDYISYELSKLACIWFVKRL